MLKISNHSLNTIAATKKNMTRQKAAVNQWSSVTDSVNLLVSKSKLVYSIFVFVDAKVKITVPFKKQQLITTSVHHTQVMWRDLYLYAGQCMKNREQGM